MLACAHPAFDRPVVLLQNIVEILHRSMLAILGQSALGFELYDGSRVSSVLVGVDHPRSRMVCTSQGFGQKALGRDSVLLGREEKIQGRLSARPIFLPRGCTTRLLYSYSGDCT